EFFKGKRPWSRIKDQVLGNYMSPYLTKVMRLGRPILLIDAFAGPGVFEDNTPGSPLIMLNAAREKARGNYIAIFVNKFKDHHEKLVSILKKTFEKNLGSLTIPENVFPILGDSQKLLQTVHEILEDHTVFLYLDPFGLKGCEFDTIRLFLERPKDFSTEIVININVPAMHRLATWSAVKKGKHNQSIIQALHRHLTQVFDGEWWKDFLWTDEDPDKKATKVINQYRRRLANYLPFTGSCPVRENENSRLKYFIVFCSRHPHAMELMNDEMCKAYYCRIHEARVEGTLFAQTDWRHERPTKLFDRVVLEILKQNERKSRREIWLNLIQQHFMKMTESEFNETIRRLMSTGKIDFEDIRGTGRLNDDAKLFIRNE
ncbi:MAG: three-Cys-motif partner protein TcmP, partial [Candidatus Hodarchaeales archaeon]